MEASGQQLGQDRRALAGAEQEHILPRLSPPEEGLPQPLAGVLLRAQVGLDAVGPQPGGGGGADGGEFTAVERPQVHPSLAQAAEEAVRPAAAGEHRPASSGPEAVQVEVQGQVLRLNLQGIEDARPQGLQLQSQLLAEGRRPGQSHPDAGERKRRGQVQRRHPAHHNDGGGLDPLRPDPPGQVSQRPPHGGGDGGVPSGDRRRRSAPVHSGGHQPPGNLLQAAQPHEKDQRP